MKKRPLSAAILGGQLLKKNTASASVFAATFINPRNFWGYRHTISHYFSEKAPMEAFKQRLSLLNMYLNFLITH